MCVPVSSLDEIDGVPVIFPEGARVDWHYNLALDSLVLIAHSSFKLLIFFSRLFSVHVGADCGSLTPLG